MEKIWIKKELYFEKYEFLNIFYEFLDFYLIFTKYFFLNSKKMGAYLQVMTWQAGVLARRHVARGTTAWVRRGAEATWQSHRWPARG